MTSTSAGSEILAREMRRLHAAEYHRMIEAGVFDEDERVELLEGVIVAVSPQNAAHALVVERLGDPHFVRLPADFVIRCQLPLALSDGDEPEPDIAVIPRDIPRSRTRHPVTARLVFEVAGESLRKDREIKAALYARAGIPEYVIVNLGDECLEVHRDPEPATGRYALTSRIERSASFASASVAGLRFEVAELLA
jgi:Uma2 family endonuclease